jgi:hypothetical protein
MLAGGRLSVTRRTAPSDKGAPSHDEGVFLGDSQTLVWELLLGRRMVNWAYGETFAGLSISIDLNFYPIPV